MATTAPPLATGLPLPVAEPGVAPGFPLPATEPATVVVAATAGVVLITGAAGDVEVGAAVASSMGLVGSATVVATTGDGTRVVAAPTTGASSNVRLLLL